MGTAVEADDAEGAGPVDEVVGEAAAAGQRRPLEEADVIVIGLGPGGEEVAGRLAEAGLDVVGVERELVGGECPYWGCIPTKMMVRAAGLLADARRIPGVAGDAAVVADWAPVAARIRSVATDDWDDRVAVERFEGKGGRFVRGSGRIVGPAEVQVGERTIRARRGIVVATGQRPAIPPIPGLDQVPYWTNRDAVAAEELPASLVVLGGGAIGVELAQVFARFGVAVTVVEASERLVALEEPEASALLGEVFAREGIEVRTSARASRVDRQGDQIVVHLDGGGSVAGEALLVATGRRTDLAAVGLDALGVDVSARSAPVDAGLRVADGVWAIGDVAGEGAFTHVAMYHAGMVIAEILGQPHAGFDTHAVPRVTFTDPEIGAVGLTEAAARAAGIDVCVASIDLATTSRGWITGPGGDGVIKLVEDAERHVLVGALSMGPMGGEVLGMLTLAVHAQLPVEVLRSMVYAFPTFHRGVEAAVDELCEVQRPHL